ncbi:MAG TPA: caspase family protein [Terrimicrobiaceae bacterium]
MAKGISIHIGVNKVDPRHYGGWSGHLNACEADAKDLETIANGKGFATSRLETASATRGAVLEGIKSAAGTLGEGDIFLLTYSGHGGQRPDRSGDEADLQDETCCLFDGQIIDDELGILWSEFAPGTRILVLSLSRAPWSARRRPRA